MNAPVNQPSTPPSEFIETVSPPEVSREARIEILLYRFKRLCWAGFLCGLFGLTLMLAVSIANKSLGEFSATAYHVFLGGAGFALLMHLLYALVVVFLCARFGILALVGASFAIGILVWTISSGHELYALAIGALLWLALVSIVVVYDPTFDKAAPNR